MPIDHALWAHPKIGASWEGFALEQTLQAVRPAEAFFWATHQGAEIDLFFIIDGKRYGVEFKLNEAPKLSRSMRIGMDNLGLDHMWIIYPGEHEYPVDEKVTVLPLSRVEHLSESVTLSPQSMERVRIER